MNAELLSVADLGEILGGASHRTVLEWRRQYRWPHIRVGQRLFFTPEHVEQILAKHAVVPTADGDAEVVPIDGRTARSAARSKGG